MMVFGDLLLVMGEEAFVDRCEMIFQLSTIA